MIVLKPIDSRSEVKKLFASQNIEFKESSACVSAVCNGETLGFCLYDFDKNGILIHYITPKDDIPLADGILRSTLHVAAERSIMDAYYSENADEAFIEKLGFIKNKSEKRLDINKLFVSCCSCKEQEK